MNAALGDICQRRHGRADAVADAGGVNGVEVAAVNHLFFFGNKIDSGGVDFQIHNARAGFQLPHHAMHLRNARME